MEGEDGYAYFPVVPEGLSQKSVEGYEVITADGNTLGNLRKIIIDTNTGDIMYGIVELDQDAIETKGMEVAGGSLMPLPWSAFRPSEKEGVVKLNVSSQQLANIPGYGEEMNIADIRGYWELHEPQLTKGLPSPHYMGADRADKMELQRAWQHYKQAKDNFNNLDVVYRDDVANLERDRKQYEEAFLRFSREGGKKTIQQKLQSQIFR